MKKNLIIIVVALLVSLTSFSQNVSGVYKTDYRQMTLNQIGNKVTGTYEGANGKIQAILNGNRLVGTWRNSASNKSGNFEFIFNSDYSSFTGKYGYDNNGPTKKWNGTKISPTSAPLYDGFVGSVYSGKAKSSKSGRSWPTKVKIVSYDHISGRVEGEIEWPSLNSVHKIEGKFTNSQFTFKEVAYIKKGSANLNCQYTTTLSNNKISGTWTDPSSDKGTIELNNNNIETSSNSNNTKINSTSTPLYDGFVGSIYSGKAKSSKSGNSWPTIVKIISYDNSSGKVKGEIQWTSLNSVHKIEGTLSNSQFTFKEVAFIKKGRANLNCQYTTTLSSNKISGNWTDPSSDKGTIELIKSDNNNTKVTESTPSVPTSNNNKISGIYKTDFNDMTLSINGNHVTGTYKHRSGKIDGVLTNNKLVGTWTQTNGKGNFEFIFNSDFSAFTGKWSYNNSAPSSTWNGTKIKSNSSPNIIQTPSLPLEDISGEYITDYGKMILSQSGNRITGTYEGSNGKIDAILDGNILTGNWRNKGNNKTGNFEFIFNSNFSSFKGRFGYNNASLTKNWTGTKTKSSSSTTVVQTPQATNIAGIYKTDFNEMTLSISGNRVTGIYKHNGGKIEGVLTNNKLVGTWTQTNGKGNFEFIFNSEFSSFTGNWGYNNSVPNSKWNGTKISSTSTPLYDGFVGSIFSGKAKSSKSGNSWPTIVKIVSYDHSSGKVEGEIQWTSLNSVHKIEGKLTNSQFTFKEVAFIKKGRANLNCQYTTTLSSNKISGNWTDPSSDKGTIELIKSDNNNTKVTESTPSVPTSNNNKISGIYKTDFNDMTLSINGNHVTGTYKHRSGKIDGVLTNNKLVGTWTQTNGKGNFEFIFNSDFSSFTGKWGYNDSVPNSKWNGTKISGTPELVGTTIPTKSGFPDPNITSPSGETVLPVNIIGSWTTYGNIKKMGRMSFWQKGDEFVAINCYPILNTDTGEYSGRWRCFKGEGKLDGRKIECKFSDSTTDGSKKETDFFYWYGKISGDNSEITYYTIWNGATKSVIGLPFRRIQ